MAKRDIDRGLKRFVARLRGLREGAKITVGIHAGDGTENHPSGGTVADVATLAELGSLKSAPAGFLRSTIDQQRATLARRLAASGALVLDKAGGQVEAFGQVAAELARDVRARVPVDTGTVSENVRARVNGTDVTGAL